MTGTMVLYVASPDHSKPDDTLVIELNQDGVYDAAMATYSETRHLVTLPDSPGK